MGFDLGVSAAFRIYGFDLPDMLHRRGQVFIEPVFEPDAVKKGI